MTDLYFVQVPVGRMANLAYIVGSRATREAYLIDAAWNVDDLLDRAEADGMKVVGALASHYHQDHIGGSIFGMEIEGISHLLDRAPIPIHVHRVEAEGTCKITGVSASDLVRHDSGDILEFGEIRIRFMHTPGHTPGSQCFLIETPKAPGRLVSGDTLFLGNCGRVDLPGGDPEAMYDSLQTKIGRLPHDTLLFPGHLYSEDPSSTIGDAKKTNPYLRVTDLPNFLRLIGASS